MKASSPCSNSWMRSKPARHRAVGPADPHVGGAIERAVERAGEVEVGIEQRFDRGSVLVDIGLQAGAGNGERAFAHCGSPTAGDPPMKSPGGRMVPKERSTYITRRPVAHKQSLRRPH